MGVGGLAERVTSGWGGHGAEISCPYLILSLHKLPVPAEYQALCAWLVVSSPPTAPATALPFTGGTPSSWASLTYQRNPEFQNTSVYAV